MGKEEINQTNLAVLKKKAVASIAAIASGTMFLQIITFFSQFILTVLLIPSVFGIFSLLNAAVSVLTYFSDIGLAAALIQKKEDITSEDLKTTFTIQQCLVVTLMILGFVLSGAVSSFYQLDIKGLRLFQALITAFFLASLKTIPHILLERRIQFAKLTFVNISETVVFYSVIIFLALSGKGIESFTFGVLARGLTGLILIYLISPWMPAFGIEKQSAKKLLSFGLPMQANSLLALVKDNLFILFLGKLITPTQLGYYYWAKSWSEAPLRLIMDSLSRVMFPLYARLQHNLPELNKILQKMIYFQSAIIFPLSAMSVVLIGPVVSLIPRYGKWMPAVPLFYLFVLTSVIASIYIPLTHVLNATGRVRTTLNLMIFWTLLVWLATPLAVKFLGLLGVGWSALLTAFSSFVIVPIIRKIIPFNLSRSFATPLFSALILLIFLFAMVSIIPQSMPGIIFEISAGFSVYTLLLFLFDGQRLKKDLSFTINILK